MIKIKNTLSHIEYFVLIIAFLSSLINYFYRTGLDNDVFLIIKAFILSSLMILLPSFIIKQENKIYLKPILLFFIFIFIIFLSIFKIIFNFDISFVLYLTGFIILIISLLNIRFIQYNLKNFLYILFAILFCLLVLSAYYSNHYTSPLIYEKIINGSWAHRDILYHAAISGMYKTYFFIGTGVDGFVPYYYHIGSHIIVALFSEILETNTLIFYSLLWPIILTPIFFQFFIYSCVEASKFFSKLNKFKKINSSDYIIYFFIFFLFGLPLDKSILPENYHYLFSQSYSVALILLFFIINLFLIILNNRNSYELENIRKSNVNEYFIVLFIILLAILASFTKVSFVFITTFIFIFLYLRLKLYTNFIYNLFLIFWFIFITYFYFNFIHYFSGNDLFDKSASMSHYYSIKDQLLFSYISIIYVLMRLYSLKIFSIKELLKNFRSFKIIDVEFTALLIIALFFISHQYFKGIQLYISYIFIIANINLFKSEFLKER